MAGSASGPAYPSDGQPPVGAARPVSRSIRGLYAPSQMPTSCAGAGPGVRAVHPVVLAVDADGAAVRRPTPRG